MRLASPFGFFVGLEYIFSMPLHVSDGVTVHVRCGSNLTIEATGFLSRF